jgi:hypothetical protein
MSAEDKNKPSKVAIADDVYLYTTRIPGPPLSFLYELECCRFNVVNFSMDFAGSVNFELEGGGDVGSLQASVAAQPFKRTRVCKLVLQDASKGASLKNSYSWGLDDPDTETVTKVLEEDRSRIEGELARVKKLGFGNDSASLLDIAKRCKANKVRTVSFGLLKMAVFFCCCARQP